MALTTKVSLQEKIAELESRIAKLEASAKTNSTVRLSKEEAQKLWDDINGAENDLWNSVNKFWAKVHKAVTKGLK